MQKTENGKKFDSSAYAYVGDPDKVTTWKVRLEKSPGKVTFAQLGRAAATLSKEGYRGDPLDVPDEAKAKIRKRIRAEYEKLGVASRDMSEEVRDSE